MIWRVVLATILTVAIFFAWVQMNPPNPPARAPELPAAAPGGRADVRAAPPAKSPGAAEAPAVPDAPPAAVRPVRERVTERVVVPGLFEYLADSRGASLPSVYLASYHESVARKDSYRLLSAPAKGLATLGLEIEAKDGPGIPDDESWILRSAPRENAPPVLEFENEAAGIRIAKTVAVGEPEDVPVAQGVRPAGWQPRHLKVRVTFTNTTAEEKQLSYRLHGPAGIDTENTTVQAEGSDVSVVFGRWHGQRIYARWVAAAKARDAQEPEIAWVALCNNYFTAILFPLTSPDGRRFAERGFADSVPDASAIRRLALKEFGREPDQLDPRTVETLGSRVYPNARCGLRSVKFTIPPGQSVTHEYGLYLGTRESVQLEAYGSLDFEGVNQYGAFGILVRLFMGTLRVLKTVAFGYWGIAIILLTLILKLILHPLNKKSQASMQRFQKRMQAIKPEMDELKVRFGDNRTKMNVEMQKLWKKHGVNPAQPMAGCLILFLQLPIWWGLYSTLQYSIGLRQAGFLWFEDLTQPDRLFRIGLLGVPLMGDKLEFFNLLPVLYVVLTIIQQRMQPRPDDPQMLAQYRMMTFMMVIFGFIFYSFPAGFMLYIMTNAGLSILESRIIKAELARESSTVATEAAAQRTGPEAGGAMYPGRPKKAEEDSGKAKGKKSRW